ncbi:cytochrome c family protein [Novosphingobium sp. NBM11]|uniref:c-type cytochrome n=1 Tax=Novosphingobium sp. NBM11 TaxID=2596914 RepID=UPI0018921641|nr:cytochrome c family protein [Novosphingobium sp. NBM11]MBF5091824.1 cytochrome c family protein [Novosphingobium sp. NBM11]
MKFVAVMAGLAAVGIAASAASAAPSGPAGDAGRGRTVFARCAACHDLNTGATRLGPSLKGIVGRKSAAMANFNYSAQMKAKNVTWNKTTLDAFLTSPTRYVPGTRMAFAGLPNPQDRADLIAYLQQAAR